MIETARVVADALGLELTVRAAVAAPWHPGRCAELLLGEAVVGHAGELHPKVCRAFGVPARTSVAELDLDALLARAGRVPPAPHFSTYPVAKEDVALIVADDLPAAELAATLREGAGPLCESVRLFDVYTGPQVGEGRKSLAFALRFRAPDRTLTEKETAAARDAAVALAARAARRPAARLATLRSGSPRTAHARAISGMCRRVGVQPSGQRLAQLLAGRFVQRRDVRRRRALAAEER